MSEAERELARKALQSEFILRDATVERLVPYVAIAISEATRAKDERIAELEKALNSLTARWLKTYHAGKKLNPHENPSARASADTFGECAEQLQTMIHHVLSNTSPPLQDAMEAK
jgi:hypothetical protein